MYWEELSQEEQEAIRKETHETCNEREKREWLAKNSHLPNWVESVVKPNKKDEETKTM